MSNTNIEWANKSLNVITGCRKVSDGCKNCYAELMHKRLRAMNSPKYQHPFNEVQVEIQAFKEVNKWKDKQRIFLNSMSDTFHKEVSFGDLVSIFRMISYYPQHTWLLLTKRPENALRFYEQLQGLSSAFLLGKAEAIKGFESCWLGVSVENQQTADERIPLLLKIPAAIRFVSCEPLLGAVDLDPPVCDCCGEVKHDRWCGECGEKDEAHECCNSVWFELRENINVYGERGGIDWVIVGGETGPNARPMKLEWLREIQHQCQEADVPFFYKNIGGVRKPKDGHLLDGIVYNQLPKESRC